MADVWANLMACHCRLLPFATISKPHAILQGAVTWRNRCRDRARLQGVRIPSAILKIVYRHFLNLFLVFNAVTVILGALEIVLWRAAAFVSSPIHLFERLNLSKFGNNLCPRVGHKPARNKLRKSADLGMIAARKRRKKVISRNVKESGKVIPDPRPELDQHQTWRSFLAHSSYHVWSTPVNAFVSLLANRRTRQHRHTQTVFHNIGLYIRTQFLGRLKSQSLGAEALTDLDEHNVLSLHLKPLKLTSAARSATRKPFQTRQPEAGKLRSPKS